MKPTPANNKSKKFRSGSLRRKLTRQEKEQAKFEAETERLIGLIKGENE